MPLVIVTDTVEASCLPPSVDPAGPLRPCWGPGTSEVGPRDHQEEGRGSTQVRLAGAGTRLCSWAGLWGAHPRPCPHALLGGGRLAPKTPIPSCCTHTCPGQARHLPWTPEVPCSCVWLYSGDLLRECEKKCWTGLREGSLQVADSAGKDGGQEEKGAT